MDVIVTLYIGGAHIWSCYLALFRVLYIRSQKWLTNTFGVKNLLNLMLVTGALQTVTFSALLVYWDDESSALKMCKHYSFSDLEILKEFRVKYITFQI